MRSYEVLPALLFPLQLLIALAVYDTTYLVGAFLEAFRKSFNIFFYWHRVLFPYVIYPLHSMAMTG